MLWLPSEMNLLVASAKGPPLHQQLNEKEGNTRQGMGDRPVGETEGEWGGGKRVEGAGWWVNTDFHQRETDREIF